MRGFSIIKKKTSHEKKINTFSYIGPRFHMSCYAQCPPPTFRLRGDECVTFAVVEGGSGS